MTKEELQKRYPDWEVICQWRNVPENLKTRNWFTERGVKIRGNAKVKAVKCNVYFNPQKKYFLFDVEDFREQLKSIIHFTVKAFYAVNGELKSEIVLITLDQTEAENKLRELRGKLYLGLMAVYEIKVIEKFEAKV